ncbi:unnamed protein product [Malus baccata var. baccata]
MVFVFIMVIIVFRLTRPAPRQRRDACAVLGFGRRRSACKRSGGRNTWLGNKLKQWCGMKMELHAVVKGAEKRVHDAFIDIFSKSNNMDVE